MTTGPKRPNAEDLIPDLDVPQRPVSRAPVPKTSGRPAAPAELELALDTNPAMPSSASAEYFGSQALSGGDFDADYDALERSNFQAVEAVRVHQEAKRRHWPSGATPDSATLNVPREIVAETASYGDAPGSALLAPMYAARVFSRRRAVGARAKSLRAELSALERKRDEVLSSMAEARLPQVQGRVDALRAADELIEERRRTLASSNAEFEAKSTAIAERLRIVDQRANEKSAERAACASVHERAQEEFERTDAKHKRCFIELRPFAELIEKGVQLTAEQAQKVKQLEAQVAAITPHLDAAKERFQTTTAALATMDRDLDQLAKERQEIERQRRLLEVNLTQEIRSRSTELDQARAARVAALADIGRDILALRGRIDVDDALLDRILEDDRVITEKAAVLDAHLRALDAYDADAYKKGFLVAGVLILAIIVAIAWAVT